MKKRLLISLFAVLCCIGAWGQTDGPANNEIWYTSTDGEAVEFDFESIGELTANKKPDGKDYFVATFAKDVTTIPESTFEECSTLTSIIIPASVKTIESSAFWLCENLSSVAFAKDSELTTIGEDAFYACYALSSIELPKGLKEIGEYAFSDSGIAEIELPKGLETIGAEAFAWCAIKEIEIPASVKSLSAFTYCESLESVTFAEESQLTNIGGFEGCCALTSIELPGSLKVIEWSAFNGCHNLTSITLPEGLTTIGDAAFASCGLSSIVIPSTVTYIGDQAFGGTGSADGSATFADGSVCKVLTEGAFCYSNFGNIILPESLTEIQDYSLDGCENLKSLIIPENVTTLGNKEDNWSAAIGAPNLKSLIFAGESKLTYIGDYAISGCASLTSLVIPASVTTIGQDAFNMSGSADGCLTFANGSKYTGEGDTRAFASAYFGTIVLPESITTLGSHSFIRSKCKSITIPKGVKSVETGSFAYCENLKEIIIFCTTPPTIGERGAFDAGMWDGLPSTKPLLVVPSGCKSVYEAANSGEEIRWNELTIVEGDPLDVTEVGWASFYNENALDIPSCAKVFYASEASGSTLTLTEITGTIPAKTGVIVQIPAGTMFPISTSNPDAITGNLLRGTLTDISVPEDGVYVLSPATTESCPVFQNYTGTTLGANKAYILKSDVTAGDVLNFEFAGAATAIDRVNVQPTKASSVRYNLNGQAVGADYKGIVIVNGKKMLNK